MPLIFFAYNKKYRKFFKPQGTREERLPKTHHIRSKLIGKNFRTIRIVVTRVKENRNNETSQITERYQ